MESVICDVVCVSFCVISENRFMKRLFSPWRSKYIQTFKHPNKSGKCLFCRIAREKKDAENLVVVRGKLCYVVLNLYPYNSGHVMIIPYKHTPDLDGLSEKESAEAMKLTGIMKKALTKLSKPHGFNFGANLGRVAGAGIEDHVHFHLVPRWNGDTNFMPVLAETKVVSEELWKTWRELRKELGR